MKCPNKNTQEWKDLVTKVGTSKAYLIWDNESTINKKNIGQEIPKLFESEIYEALGFIEAKKTEFTNDEAQSIVDQWKANAVNLRGNKPSDSELNDLNNAGNALFKKLMSLKGKKYTEAPTKATLINDLFDRNRDKQVDLSEDSPVSNLLNLVTRFFNGGLYDDDITPQQKQEAQRLYSQYVEQTGKQDIEGFKEFVNKPERQYQKTTDYNLSDDLTIFTEEDLGLNTSLSQKDFKC